MIVFGGFAPSGDRLNDVWALTLSYPEWTPILATGQPPEGRFDHSAIYDAGRDRMVVLGGSTGSPCGLNDLWELGFSDSPSWTRIEAGYLYPSAGGAAIYDPVRDRIVTFGAYGCACEQKSGCWAIYHDLTHALDLSTLTWHDIPTSGSPPPVYPDHNAIYDPTRDRMIVFGGNDIWSLSLMGDQRWVVISPPDLGRPSADAAILDPIRQRMIVLARRLGQSIVLTLDMTEERPMPRILEVSGTAPPNLGEPSAVYDVLNDRMLVFGGYNGVHWNDVWALSLSDEPTWTLLQPAGARPRPRSSHSAIYDPVGRRMIVFGGWSVVPYSDTWALSLSGNLVWQEIATHGSGPSPRANHSATYDPVRRGMVVYGGSCCAYELPEQGPFSLSLDDAEWSRLSPTGPPAPAQVGHTAVYDPSRDRIVIFSGGNDTWALGALSGGGEWEQLFPSCSGPIRRSDHTAVYDPGYDRMVTYSGFDLWVLAWGDVSTPTHASLVSVRAWPGRVRVEWFLERDRFVSVDAYRRHQGAAWVPIGNATCEGRGYCSIEDHDVESGHSYEYRLRLATPTTETWTPAAEVVVPGAPEVAIEGRRPVILSNDMTITVSLMDSGRGSLELFDAMGRRVLSRRLETGASGSQSVRLEGTNSLQPGVYLLRLQQSGRSATARALRLAH